MTVAISSPTERFTRPVATASLTGSHPLFPLPLTPFELYMLLDDRPSHPMQFRCQLRCQGDLHVAHFEAAVGQAVARHPLLAAVVRQAGEKRFEWLAAETPAVHWLTRPHAGEHSVSPYIDIRRQPGVHIVCQGSNQGWDIFFSFHHAACDGLAAMDFIADVLVGYANLELGEDRFGRKPLDRQRLRLRGRAGVSRWQWSWWLLRHIRFYLAAYRSYKRRPQPLFPHALDTSRPLDEHAMRAHHFSPGESRQLRAAAQQRGASVNSVVLRDLLLASDQLRRERGQSRGDDLLRVAIPLNMRSAADRQLPAANLVSLGFIERPVSTLDDTAGLLRGIEQDVQRMVQQNWGLAFLTGLAVMRSFPHTLTKHLRRDRCFSTMSLSSFGAVLPGCSLPRSAGHIVAGNLVVREVAFLPVLRPLQLANFSISQYAGRYTLGMRYDSRHLAPHDADAVLQCVLAQIGQSSANG